MRGRYLQILFELTKVKITLAVTVSVATGHLLFMKTLSTSVVLPALAVFVLACGSAALNQVQEARIDGRMERTRVRPIPSGRITRDWALFVAMALLGAGFYALSCIETHTYTLLVLGAFTVFWYNGVYILLKRVTAFAVVPGALVGAVPPVMGWVSAGGLATDPQILEVALFFFIWQIPHFWLLLLLFGRDYEEAGLPSLTRIFSKAQIARITFMWILAVAMMGILLMLTLDIAPAWKLIAVASSIWLGVDALGFLRPEGSKAYLPAFVKINAYAVAVMICLMGDAVF